MVIYDTKRLSEITPATEDADSNVTIVGVRDNGDGTYTDLRYSTDQLASGLITPILSASRSLIVALTANISTTGATNDTLKNDFFAEDILSVDMNSQTYFIGYDFTQDAGNSTIKWINGAQFEDGLPLIPRR